MSDIDNDITPVGYCNFRGKKSKFGIKTIDRRRHTYVIGKTGVGKSTLLENMAIDDIRKGHGLGVIDPHGDLAETLLEFVPKERVDDVIYIDPGDLEFPVAFNPLEQTKSNEFRHLMASSLMGVFKKIWPDVWSARMEYILNNTLLALLEFPDSTILSVMRMFAEKDYRKKVVSQLQDPVVRAFWENEFAKYTQRLATEAVASIQNKVGQLISNPLVRNILGQPHSSLDMREIMDGRKILIVNLSKGKIGEDNSSLLGAMVIARLQLAAMSRVDIPQKERKDFFLYVDEFQNFATDSFAVILSEARKYRLNLTLAHQYIAQLVQDQNTKVRDAVFGNVGTFVVFRVGANDAEFLEGEFLPTFTENDLVNLPKYHMYVKLMIDGVAGNPFSAEGIPPMPRPAKSYTNIIIENTRDWYATPRVEVEQDIADEWKEGKIPSRTKKKPKPKQKKRKRGESLATVLGGDKEKEDANSKPEEDTKYKNRNSQNKKTQNTTNTSQKSAQTPKKKRPPKPKNGPDIESLKQAISQSLNKKKSTQEKENDEK